MNKQTRYSPEIRERAVRMVFEHQAEYDSQRAALNSIAGKIGCTAETLRKWVRRAERDQGLREGLTTSDRERLKAGLDGVISRAATEHPLRQNLQGHTPAKVLLHDLLRWTLDLYIPAAIHNGHIACVALQLSAPLAQWPFAHRAGRPVSFHLIGVTVHSPVRTIILPVDKKIDL